MGTSQFLQTLKTFFIFERVWGIFWENFLFCFTLAHARLYSLESVWMLSYGGHEKTPTRGVVPPSASANVRWGDLGTPSKSSKVF
jgi:hypothetical protein